MTQLGNSEAHKHKWCLKFALMNVSNAKQLDTSYLKGLVG